MGNKLSLEFAWKKRCKDYTKSRNLMIKSCKLGILSLKLNDESVELRMKADRSWNEAVLSCGGVDKWFGNGNCKLKNGEVYKKKRIVIHKKRKWNSPWQQKMCY